MMWGFLQAWGIVGLCVVIASAVVVGAVWLASLAGRHGEIPLSDLSDVSDWLPSSSRSSWEPE